MTDASGSAESCPRLDQLAQRIEAHASWDHLVLSNEQRETLSELVARARERSKIHEGWGSARAAKPGLGAIALFAGAAGAGKLRAAEAIANELRLALYRVNLRRVVSNDIGETAKVLARLFDAAEKSAAILFFDEAESLFGKRSEVKDSHDRFANVEANYLLQRMEGRRGLTLLATDTARAIAPAFLRRVRFVVQFSH